MNNIFKNLYSGQIIVGTITQKKDNNLYIIKHQNRLFSAYSEINFEIEEKVFMKILSIDPKPVLKIFKKDITHDKEKDINKKYSQILNICHIENSKENIRLLSEYISSGKDIQQDLIQAYFNQQRNTDAH